MERKSIRAYTSSLPEVYPAQIFTGGQRYMVSKQGGYRLLTDNFAHIEDETTAAGRFGYKPVPYLRILLLYLGGQKRLPHE